MKIVSSYPRSGQSWLRFLICNILYPEVEHDFETIKYYTPSIDSAEQLRNCAPNVQFLFTHANIRADIYLYRHVGDVLISEYWYKKKYYPLDDSIDDWVIKTWYGQEWRKSVENGRGAERKLAFEQLRYPEIIAEVLGFQIDDVSIALKKCSFQNMANAEKKNIDILGGDQSIPYMRSGQSHQWLSLSCKYDILRQNEGELAYLGYWHPDDWEGFRVDWSKKNRYADKL